ncbi:uncharacterized protein LOC141633610 [Silene latifolia]|uniref:uncharacterized protein LOC141633610 n=1 Tax=Silene latifolia TaxID=37657 RepID=UPI003D77A39F
MEVVVQVEESEQGLIKDHGKPGSELATLDPVADPVVYKLVKVDYDGRLVPATDDELMEVENLLELEKNETVDVMETVKPVLDKDDSKTSQNKGSPQIKNKEGDEVSVKLIQDSLYTSRINSRTDISDDIMDEPDLDSRPNFSLLEGEINLDKLNVRELQETFRATFGRKTSVKDKAWLKRRISMGLTNSCDVSVTSFVINDGKLLNKMDDLCKTMACEDSMAGEAGSALDDVSVNSGSHSNSRKDVVVDMALKSCLLESAYKSDDSLDHRAAKRVRKPTKRYIEELSDKETNDPSEKSISPSKRIEQDKFSSSSAIKTAWSVNTGAFVTRRDSIGGSGVQVPYVSRVRRCRPRQSIPTLFKFGSCDVAITSKTTESSDAPNTLHPGTGCKAELVDTKYPSEDAISCEDFIEKQSVASMSDSSRDREPKGVDSGGCTSRDTTTGTNSDDNIAIIPTAKGGMRRKHHRAWTLAEVMKLVDGVSRFGPGRWSEIKRLSFSSYSYRTAVDLKDKWRNLLKASSYNLPAEKGMNPRAKAPIPIPAPILVKVRELAELNGQSPGKQGQWEVNWSSVN